MPRAIKPPANHPPRDQVIREALARLDWSRRDLAAQLGVSPQRVSDVLGGRRQVSPEWWVRVAQALGLEPAELGVEADELTRLRAENARLRAEIDRLRKAAK